MRAVWVLLAALCIALPAGADTAGISQSPREPGIVVVRDVSIRDGHVLVRVDSNGCTGKDSFRLDAVKEQPAAGSLPRYRLTLRRIRVDDCKAMVWDGVEIDFDLAKDLGLTGRFAVSLDNPVFVSAGAGTELKKALIQATAASIEMEIKGCRRRLQAAEEGTGPKGNAAKLRSRLRDLERERQQFAGMKPEAYPEPVSEAAGGSTVLDRTTPFGPLLPAMHREVVVSVDGPVVPGDLLRVEGTSRSGPFYRLAGVAGDQVLETGKQYRLEIYQVYRREYFGFMADYYVYVSAVR